ncbi:MAG: hypothetical protein RJA49_1194 [Actinomycetota bacterium]
MSERRFLQVDVFSSVPFGGNPLAVVVDGDGLTTEQMQTFAKWTNLSETTFLLPPTDAGADYRVRIFTTDAELPFAGHPTLGSCHAWLASGGVPRSGDEVVQECAAGLVRLRRTGDEWSFAAPPLIRSGPVDDDTLDRLVAVLRIDRAAVVDAEWADNGPGWVALLLRSADDVLAVTPGPLDGFFIGLVGPTAPGSAESFEVRAFFPQGSMTAEDPVTGSLNASLAQWLVRSGVAVAPFRNRQGTALGRAGVISIEQTPDGQIWVGGSATTYIAGTVTI